MSSYMRVLRCFSRVLLALAISQGQPLDDEGVALLQMKSRLVPKRLVVQKESPRVFVPPVNQAFVGRYDISKTENSTNVRFDAIGFEIKFSVQGATDVHIILEQTISGLYGWFADPATRSQYFSQQRPQPVGVRHGKHGFVQSSINEFMQPAGSQPHHFLVYVDGEQQRTPLQAVQACRICTFDTAAAVPGKLMEYPVATGLDPSKSHTIRIIKTSEPEWCVSTITPNWLSFHGLMLDSGEAVLPTESRPLHRIEFIGDSWMAGFANVCNGTYDEEQMGPMGGEPPDIIRYGSYALAWPFVACEALGAECHSTMLSGMGVYCNTHASDQYFDCLSEDRLPQYWERTLATEQESHWNMDNWTPAVVVVSASQNDHMFDSHRSVPEAVRTYESFIRRVVSAYPETQIVLTCGPFEHTSAEYIGGPECALAEQAVSQLKQMGVKVHFLSLMHFARNMDLGQCAGHFDESASRLVGEYFANWLQALS